MYIIENKEGKVKVNTREKFVGPANTVILLESIEDIDYLLGYTVDLIICNFSKTKEIHDKLKPYVTEGYLEVGQIRYLKNEVKG